jgi:hypothetical protein
MTQTQMTAYLADKIGISKRQAKAALDELNEVVTRQLKKRARYAWRASECSASASSRHVWVATRPQASRSRFRRVPVYDSRQRRH